MPTGIYRYLIYRITNIQTGRIYIGAHATQNPSDRYMGSCRALREDIRALGRDTFSKEILHEFDTSDEMWSKEEELVNEEFVRRHDTYNIALGGRGQSEGRLHPLYRKSPSPEARARMSELRRGVPRPDLRGRKHTAEWRQKMSERQRGKPGRPHTEETKRKIGEGRRGEKHWFYGKKRPDHSERMSGANNFFFGEERSEETKAKISEKMREYWATHDHPSLGRTHSEEALQKMRKPRRTMGKTYEVTTPDGNIEVVINLRNYCLERGLRPSSMYAILRGGQQWHRGYTVRRLGAVAEQQPIVGPVHAAAQFVSDLEGVGTV